MKDFISTIIGRVKTERQSIADAVTAGTNINTFEDYQRLVGRYEGLTMTLDIINEILTEDEEDE
jgi:GH35 family endo-1,4-beta-xylanase